MRAICTISLLTLCLCSRAPGSTPDSPPPPVTSTAWETNGPYGGDVYCLARIEDSVLLAGTAAGVFESHDWGGTWKLKSAGLRGAVVEALIVDRHQRILAATDRGIFWREKNGTQWARTGRPGFYSSIAVDAGSGIYAGSDTGLETSQDGGLTWVHRRIAGGDEPVIGLVADRTGTLYAATHNAIYVSHDTGESFEPRYLGSGSGSIASIAIGGSRSDDDAPILAAGTASGQVFYSGDGGSKWLPISSINLAGAVSALLISSNLTLYAATDQGLWVFEPSPASWSRVGAGYAGGAVYALLSAGDRIFLGASSGVQGQSGRTWSPQDTGIWAQAIRAVAVGAGDLVVAAARSGLFVSGDGSHTWTYSGEPRARIDCLAVAPDGGLFAGTLSTGRPTGILRSTDRGLSWEVASTGLPPDTNVYSIAADENGALYAATQVGLYQSLDHGETWQEKDEGMGPESLRDLISLPGGVLYTCSRNGIFRSADRAMHWASVNTGLRVAHAEHLAASSDGVLYANSGPFVYRSKDHGASWEWRSRASRGDGPLQLVCGQGGELFAGDLQSGVWKSKDGGAHWDRIDEGLYSTSVTCLAMSPSGKLLAGTNGFSVWEWKSSSNSTALALHP